MLTKAQRAMVDVCMERGAPWVTTANGGNDVLLRGWEERGWVRKTGLPDHFPPCLNSYEFTEAGRRALAEGGGDG